MNAAFALLLLAAQTQDAKARLGVWETGKASTEPLAPSAVRAREEFVQRPAEAVLKGDAVLFNGRLSVVVRRVGVADLYDTQACRASLTLVATDGTAVPFEAMRVTELTRGAVAVEIVAKSPKGTSLSAKLRLQRDQPFLEIAPGDGAAKLRLECVSRYAILPDFFADDIVIDAARLPSAVVEAPSENFLVQLAGKGDSIAMAVFENRGQDLPLVVRDGAIASSDIDFGKKGKAWVALLEGPALWHAFEIQKKDSGRVTPVGWKMPFRAMWRADLTNTLGLFDSWEMALQDKEGGDFLRPAWFGDPNQRLKPNRQCFDAAIGGMLYPAFVDAKGDGHVQPFNAKGRMELSHRGPGLLYPVNRLPQTPLEIYTVVDVMRNTLGVGPCEHILDLAGQKQELKGRATCSVRDELNPMYSKGEQKARRADAERILQQGETFVKHIRGRIDGYVEFGRKMRELLAARKKAAPEIAAAVEPLEKLLAGIDAEVEARKDKIKTPEYAAGLFAEFRKSLLDAQGPDAAEKVKKWAEALVDVGGNQDELVSHCRWVVKNVRQKAGLIAVQEPKAGDVAAEIRARAQEALRNPSVHETMRH